MSCNFASLLIWPRLDTSSHASENLGEPQWSKLIKKICHPFWSQHGKSDRKANKNVLLLFLISSKAATNTKLTLAHDQLLLKLIPFSTLFPGALLLYIKTSNQRNSWQKRQTHCRQVSSNFSSNLSWKSICQHLAELLHSGETGHEVFEVFQKIYFWSSFPTMFFSKIHICNISSIKS